MLHHEDVFRADDGLKLYENYWLPQGPIKAVVVAVHGFTTHGGRHVRLAAKLNKQGYAVFAIDLRGHGKSEGERAYVRSFDDYLADVRTYLKRVHKREPNVPMFLFGHSMGGAIITSLAIDGSLDNVRGVVLSGPAIQIGDGVFPILRKLAAAASRVFPTLRITKLGLSQPSRDAMFFSKMTEDPLIFRGRFPVSTANEILRAAYNIRNHMESVRIPFLILQSSSDGLISPNGSKKLLDKSQSKDKTLKFYDGQYHELIKGPEKRRVMSDIVEWLDARV